jgi:hypothetical protein
MPNAVTILVDSLEENVVHTDATLPLRVIAR